MQSDTGKIRWLTPLRSLFFDFPPDRYRYGPEHFIQANLFQMAPMLALLAEQLPASPAEAAADLFCGCGFFTLPLARRCQRVLALESDPDNLARPARQPGRSIASATSTFRPHDALRAELPPLDLVVLDPPRGGLSAATHRPHRPGAGKKGHLLFL